MITKESQASGGHCPFTIEKACDDVHERNRRYDQET